MENQYLRLLSRGFVLIRMACYENDVDRACTIADALHTLPVDLAEGRSLEKFEEHFLTPAVDQYPYLQELVELFREAYGDGSQTE